MKKYILLLTVILLGIQNLKSQNMQFYTLKWKQVEKLLNEQRARSAIQVIDEIYQQAQKDNLQEQILKCDIYYAKSQMLYQEDAFINFINRLETDLKTAPFPNKAIIHSMLGELYWQYYEQNGWKIMDRTQTESRPEDIKTWSAEDFIEKSIEHFNASLAEPEKLKKYSINFYKELIKKGDKPKWYPTLYDFLAYRSVNFYSNPEASITRPRDYFQINDTIYYAETQIFANANIESQDTLSLHYNGIRTLQKWLQFRLKDSKNTEALVFAERQRIEFVNNFSVLQNKTEKYIDFLKNLANKYPKSEQTPLIQLTIAQEYFNLAEKYDLNDTSSYKYKNDYKIVENICQSIIKNTKDTNIVNQAKNLLAQINKKYLQAEIEQINIPNEKFAIKLDYRNIDKVFVEIYSMDDKEYDKLTIDYGKDFLQKLKSKKILKKYTFKLVNPDDKQLHSTEIVLDGLPLGEYLIFISDKNNKDQEQTFTYELFTISNIALLTEKLNDGTVICRVVNRTNGKPIENASITAYYTKYNYTLKREFTKIYGKYTSDKNGEFIIEPSKESENLTLVIKYKNDQLNISNAVYSEYHKNSQKKGYETLKLFTDRAIYRPGQIVYFKGLLIKYDKNNQPSIVQNKKVELTLIDANYQDIETKTFKTNEYGSFSGSFIIPQQILPGQMLINSRFGSITIQVEEYKRPTFEVKIFQPQKQYIVNQLVEVQGEAQNYSGVKLSNATVRYQIKRIKRRFCWDWWNFDNQSEEVIIKEATTTTDKYGKFSIKFEAIPDLSEKKDPDTYFDYIITADVTDINGETQSTSKTISIGYYAFSINTNLPEYIDKQEFTTKYDTLKLEALTPNHQKVNATGEIQLWSLRAPKTALKEKYWNYPDLPIYTQEQWYKIIPGTEYKNESNFHNWKPDKKIWAKNFNTEKNNDLNIQNFKNLPSGAYKLLIKTQDKFGNKIEKQHYFVIYDKNSNKLPYPTDGWAIQLTETAEVGDIAEFSIGAYSHTRVIMQIILNDTIIQNKVFTLNNNKTLIKIPVKEKYRGNFKVIFTHITRNRVYNYQYTVNVPYTSKQLNFEFATFRDKLKPGQQEEWKIIIKDKKGDPQLAELLTTMYDASLDAFVPNVWNASFYKTNPLNINIVPHQFNSYDLNSYSTYQTKYYSYKNWELPELYWYGINFYYNPYKRKYKKGRLTTLSEENMPVMENQEPILSKDIPENVEEIEVRKDFSENAFFYPQLRTNENGELVISFKMPESLTRWHFMGFAHTKDLKYGLFEKFITTQKELSIMPNVPRFFRQGDTLFFSAKISNLTDKTLKGNVKIEFYDQITGKKINILTSKQSETQKFAVEKQESIPIRWEIAIPENAQLITYKIIAKAGNFSDGEQKTIPVLSNRMLITETMPLAVGPNQTKNFTMQKLLNAQHSKTLKNYRLTLEYTSNPAWYAIEALPYLIEYPYECNEQTFSRIYANTLAAYILNSSPKIKDVFNTWAKYQPSALNSNLQKNQELKNIILTETPWVMDAKDQTQQMHNLAILFDQNKINDENNRAIQKLEKEQAWDGGWAWFPGMEENWFVTQYIAQGIGHLKKINVISDNDKLFKMGQKAIEYTDKKMFERYTYIKDLYKKKKLEKYLPSPLIINYLYTRTFYKKPLQNKYAEAYTFFYNQLKKYWTQYSIYEQALLALTFYRNNDTDLAKLIIASLKERALYNDELGMYWKENTYGYYWYQNPIQTQATMIEAFYEIEKDTQSVDSMKIWLLKNKQTNNWETTIATAQAVYSLLLTGSKNLLQNNQIVPVKLGDTLIDPAQNPQIQTLAGSGYYKVSFDAQQIKPQMANITVNNKNNITTWGAIYWQYFENLDKITQAQSPLQIKKQLYKKITTDRGDKLIPIKEGDQINIGDEIVVRLEIRTDRDMEYVHLKDMRASGFEPVDVISQYKRQSGIAYYQTTKDASTNFFFDYLPKGTYVIEYSLRATVAGNFSNGISTLQCMYAPEFASHSKGIRVKIK